MKKNINKGGHAFKGYASSYNVKILILFNPEIQIKDTESAIKQITSNIHAFLLFSNNLLVCSVKVFTFTK